MPRFLVPKKRGLHRRAGIALFKALLAQCRAIPLKTDQRSALQNVVRNRFRANCHHVSQRKIKLAFHAGYTGLDMLDASAAGNTDSTSRIAAYLSQIPPVLARPQRRPKSKPLDTHTPDPPPGKKFFDVFPRPSVEGIRKVPHMVDAHGIPFVRYGKPQPKSVSRVIRQKVEAHAKKVTYRRNLGEYWFPLGRYEDRWDSFLASYCGFTDIDVSTFDAEFERENERLSRDLNELARKNAEMAAKMQAVVDKEAELAQQEKAERQCWRKECRSPPR